MTTTVVHSGAVDSYAGATFSAVIVGDPPQWDDTSDATYARSEAQTDGSASSPIAPFDPVPDLTELQTLTITVRYSTSYPTGTLSTGGDPRIVYYDFRSTDDPDVSRILGLATSDTGHTSAIDDDDIHEFTHDIYPAVWMSDGDKAFYEPLFRAALQGGAFINFVASSDDSHYSFASIYKVTLEVTGTGLVTETLVTRLWPRDDALGAGTANRLVPPPRANRIVGRQP